MNKKTEEQKIVQEDQQENKSDKKKFEIDFKDFFINILIPFTPPQIVIDSIKVLLPGDTTASDFEVIIDKEAEEIRRLEQEQKLLGDSTTPKLRPKQTFKSLFFMLVNSLGLENEISTIRHAIGVLGILKVRNAIMGMSLYQHFNPKLSLRFEKIAGGEIDKPIKFALLTETFAKENRCSSQYAFVSGLLFDIIVNIIKIKENEFAKIQSGPLKKPDEVINAIWKHCLTVGSVANFLNQKSKAKIHLGRFAFPAGILHDLGKLALIAYNPNAYNDILLKHKESLEPYYFLEEDYFKFSHESITSLMLRKIDIFTEFELPIDHHHDHDLLEIRNPDMHRIAALLDISDAIAHHEKGFLGIVTETDFENYPARKIIKLEKQYIQEAIDFINQIKF